MPAPITTTSQGSPDPSRIGGFSGSDMSSALLGWWMLHPRTAAARILSPRGQDAPDPFVRPDEHRPAPAARRRAARAARWQDGGVRRAVAPLLAVTVALVLADS